MANLSYEAEIFLALKDISTGTPEGSHDQMFFEKVISWMIVSEGKTDCDLAWTKLAQKLGVYNFIYF